jgi:hypothetical protein
LFLDDHNIAHRISLQFLIMMPSKSVQQQEKDNKKVSNHQEHQRKKKMQKHLQQQVSKPQDRRDAFPRLARLKNTEPSDVDVFVTLLDETAELSREMDVQISFVENRNTVRWTECSSISLAGVRKVRQWCLQISPSAASTEWNDWLVVKQSLLPCAGWGLFVARAMWEGQNVTLYGGIQTRTVPTNTAYAVRSTVLGSTNDTFYLDAVGGMADGHPPFLGCHMANDPNHACRIADKTKCNCYFDPQLILVLSKNLEIGDELLVDYNRFAL